MHILLLGATGRTGSLVLAEVLERGHTVVALVRSPAALRPPALVLPADQEARLTIVQGTPLSAADVEAALAGCPADAVISTLNPRRVGEGPFAAVHPTDSPPRMMAESVGNAAAAARGRPGGPARPKVVVLSALGAGGSARNTHWLLRQLFRHSNMRFTYEDHDAVEAGLRAMTAEGEEGGGVEFVLVRPTRLVEGDGGPARVFDGAEEGKVVCLTETVSRGAVARFLVDAAEGSMWDGQAPIIVG